MKTNPGLALNLGVGADLAVAVKARKNLTKKGIVDNNNYHAKKYNKPVIV